MNRSTIALIFSAAALVFSVAGWWRKPTAVPAPAEPMRESRVTSENPPPVSPTQTWSPITSSVAATGPQPSNGSSGSDTIPATRPIYTPSPISSASRETMPQPVSGGGAQAAGGSRSSSSFGQTTTVVSTPSAGSATSYQPARPASSVSFVGSPSVGMGSTGAGNNGGGGRTAPLTVELDPGVQVPVAMLDSGEALTPAQASKKQEIANQFTNEINAAAATPNSTVSPDAAWRAARENANQVYRALYGDAAFNRASIDAGREALGQP